MKLFYFINNLRIRYKLQAAYSCLFILVFSVGGIIVFSFMKHSIEKQIETELAAATSSTLNTVRTAATLSVRNHLKTVADKNLEMVKAVYKKYVRDELTEETAKSMAKEILLSQQIGTTGYIYCINSAGVFELHPKTELIGTDSSKFEFIRIQKMKKQGYLEYEWKNPGEDHARPKALYMSYFSPWDWIISVSSYREEFKDIVNPMDFHENIISQRFGKTGYAFVLNYDGVALIHPFEQGRNFLNEKDADGRRFIAEICGKKKGKIFYTWKNPGESYPRKKFVIFDHIPEFGWIVGASVYLDELYEPMNTFRNLMIATIIIGILLVFPVTLWISSFITRPLEILMKNFAKGANGDLSVRTEINSEDEIGQLAQYFNNFMERLETYGKKLSESEKKYRALFENAVEGIFQSTPDGEFLNVNPSLAKIHGFDSPEEMIKSITNIGAQIYVDPESRNKVRNILNEQGYIKGFETQFYRKDKTIIWISMNARCVKDSIGNILFYEGFVKDITLRRQTEESLKQYQEHLEDIVEKRTLELKTEIAERMRIAEELQQAKDYLENVFDNSADGIGITDKHGRFIRNNIMGVQLFGYSCDEMKGMYASELYADKDKYNEIRMILRKEGSVRRYEVMMKKKDGTQFPSETSIALLKDKKGETIGTAGVTRDITDLKQALTTLEMINTKLNLEIEERKRIEEELKQSNDYLENIFDNSADVISMVDKHGKFIKWNKMATEIFGYSFDELKNKFAFEIYPYEEELEGMLTRLRYSGIIRKYEIRMQKKDGTIFPAQISVRILKDALGNTIGSVAVVRDVSDLKNAMTEIEAANRRLSSEIRERRRIEAELRQTNAYLENVLENSADGIGLADIRGKMISWNKAAEELYGYTSEEIRGTSFAERYSDKNELEKMLSELRKNGFIKHYEILMRKKDGTNSPFEVSISLLKDENKKNIGSMCVARDLSEIKKALTETRIAREAAEQANKKIMDSLNYAKMIQQSLLVNLDVVKSYLPYSFFIWEPRDIVGGDIFYTESFEDSFIVAVIDCTGHGVPGAFMTMIAISGLRRIVKDEGCKNPAEILKRLNQIVKTTLHQDKKYAVSDDGMDVGIVRVTRTEIESQAVSFQSLDLTFAGAKIPLYSIYKDEVRVIKCDRQSIGYKRSDVNFDFTTHKIHIEKGMNFYMATDGFTDQIGGEKNVALGKKRFKNIFKEISKESFEKQRSLLVNLFEKHRGENERQDDMTVVGFGF